LKLYSSNLCNASFHIRLFVNRPFKRYNQVQMRRGMLELCLLIVVVIGIHAERILHNGTIEGRISPANTSSSVIAVRGSDSLKVTSNDGHFGMELQPGDWKLIFAVKEINSVPTEKKIQVLEGQRINLGEIRLAQ
jgi:hypothetical protein